MSLTSNLTAIQRIAVIGAGKAGRSFAITCVAAGYRVVLEDVMPANLRRAEEDYSEASLRGGYAALELATTIEDAVREVDLVVDFVPDELESKLEIFSMIDRMAPPSVILCTPTRTLSITDLASCVYRPERCVAVRGELRSGQKAQLLFPLKADMGVVETVRRFLVSLGLEVYPEADTELPMLSKNRG